MSNSEPLLGPGLAVVCVVMAVAAGLASKFVLRDSLWPVRGAAIRAAVQLTPVATVVGCSDVSAVVLDAGAGGHVRRGYGDRGRRDEADHGSLWLTVSLAAGMVSTIPLCQLTRVVPLTGVALVPVFGIALVAR